MPKILFCGKGGSGKSTLLALLSLYLSEHRDVLVVDADESNPGLARMMGLDAPRQTLMENLGGKSAFRRSMGKKTAALEEKDLLGGALRSMAALPSSAASRSGRLTLVSVGKIEHAHEGCACPMGVLARTFIGNISIEPGQWVLDRHRGRRGALRQGYPGGSGRRRGRSPTPHTMRSCSSVRSRRWPMRAEKGSALF